MAFRCLGNVQLRAVEPPDSQRGGAGSVLRAKINRCGYIHEPVNSLPSHAKRLGKETKNFQCRSARVGCGLWHPGEPMKGLNNKNNDYHIIPGRLPDTLSLTTKRAMGKSGCDLQENNKSGSGYTAVSIQQ